MGGLQHQPPFWKSFRAYAVRHVSEFRDGVPCRLGALSSPAWCSQGNGVRAAFLSPSEASCTRIGCETGSGCHVTEKPGLCDPGLPSKWVTGFHHSGCLEGFNQSESYSDRGWSGWLGPLVLFCLLVQPGEDGHELWQGLGPTLVLRPTGVNPDKQGGGSGLKMAGPRAHPLETHVSRRLR